MHSVIGVLAMLVLFGFQPTDLHAQANPEGTPAERARLPGYCQVRFKDDKQSPEARGVISKMGFQNFLSIHHYCYGLVFLQRATVARSKKDADYQRQLAVKEYGYMIRAATPGFWMRPQIYVELGRTHAAMGNQSEAMGLYRAAIELNPAYLAAYVALIGQLRGAGERSQALEVATYGLRNIPAAEVLKKAYRELGGKQPYPAPLTRERQDENAGAPDAHVESPAEHTTIRQAVDAAADPNANATGVDPAGPAPDAALDGNAPKCRFCPPNEIQEKWRETFR